MSEAADTRLLAMATTTAMIGEVVETTTLGHPSVLVRIPKRTWDGLVEAVEKRNGTR